MVTGVADAAGGRPGRWAILGLCVAVLAGVVFRVIWVEDIEYKWDEFWTFQRTQAVGRTEAFPWLGMPTSYELRHPGGTVWVFLGLSRLFGSSEPTELAQACQVLNIIAIGLLLLFAISQVRGTEREPWLWAVALVSVNPLAVLLHRKIWPPSIVPFFMMLLLFAWWRRHQRWGAFGWGLAGAVLGQVHPAGLFIAAGFFLWALLFDRRGVAWLPWAGGSSLGGLSLLPWLHYVFHQLGSSPIGQRRWSHLIAGRFWARWATEPFGLSLHYTLNDDFGDFLRYPVLGGQPTYLVAAMHVLLTGALVGLLAGAVRRLWRERGQWAAAFVGRQSASQFTQSAALWGGGLVLTASLLPIHRHYMPLAYPFMFVWLGRLALAHRGGRLLLTGLCAVQLCVSASFLGYVHVNQRSLGGEYGVPYGAQQRLYEEQHAEGATVANPVPMHLLGGLPPVLTERLARISAAAPVAGPRHGR